MLRAILLSLALVAVGALRIEQLGRRAAVAQPRAASTPPAGLR